MRGTSAIGSRCPSEEERGTTMNISRDHRPFRLHPLGLTLAALALLLLLLAPAAPAGADLGNDNRAPDLGDCQEDLQVPTGNKVAFHVYAEGVQVYRWNGTSWIFVGPEAMLFA